MNNQWKSFLESQDARISADGSVTFDGQPFPPCALFDLSHLGLIRISGEDAESFLQGQFTNDIREVTPQWSQMSSFCSPKGRMLAIFRLFKLGEDYLLQMPRETHATVLKRLPMFVLMSKAQVSDATDELVSIGIAGECAPNLLQPLFPELPMNAGEARSAENSVLIRLPGEVPRFLVTGSVEKLSELWQSARAEGVEPATRDYWSLLEIRAGIPTIYPETSDAFIPQMTNMQLIDGVSFTKGCYTGQEVVARMKYRGKLKRRMYLASVESDQPPRPGDDLFAPGSESAQGAGKVVDAARSPNGGYELLVVSEIGSYENDSLHLVSETGPKLAAQTQPYAFNEE